MNTHRRTALRLALACASMLPLAAGTAVTGALAPSAAVDATRPASQESSAAVLLPILLAGSPIAGRGEGIGIDRLIAVEEPDPFAAVDRLAGGDIDVYAAPVHDPEVLQRIEARPELAYETGYDSARELTFNPSVCSDATKLNPFAVPRIREAMNYLVDRDYVVEALLGGLAVPRWVAVGATAADHQRLAPEIRAIESAYAYDLERGIEILAEEMQRLGATRQGGQWMYAGRPVELIGIARTEDERRQIGDYFATQLESAGFSVLRQYLTSAEAAPIWQASDPAECAFHFYTGGWVTRSIERDSGSSFQFYYTPAGMPRPLWQAYDPDPAFAELAQRLGEREFTSVEERRLLFAEALRMAMADSVRVWLADAAFIVPRREEIEVASDSVTGIWGSDLWPTTLRRRSSPGGSLTWASPALLVEPWNPVAGTNWPYDEALYRATGERSFVMDPRTGLPWPQRVQRFEVTARRGLPIALSSDWLQLEFAEQIVVPDDAWVDWDALRQRFVTASERFAAPRTALLRTVAVYPSDLFDAVRWHDGSALSLADMILPLILTFDRGNPESAVYDEVAVPLLESFMSSFRGIRIASTDPLTIEYYTDSWAIDAESSLGDLNCLWPEYGFGEAPWHAVAIGLAAEAKGLAAFTADRAVAYELEQLHYVDGPTLDLLAAELDLASSEGLVPYGPTMRDFLGPREEEERYGHLAAWYRRHHHFWVGTGPFELHAASVGDGSLVLERASEYTVPELPRQRLAGER